MDASTTAAFMLNSDTQILRIFKVRMENMQNLLFTREGGKARRWQKSLLGKLCKYKLEISGNNGH